MDAAYYYFAASLPMLLWERKVPMSVGDFLAECGRLLSAEDGLLVKRLLEDDLGETTGHTQADRWIRFNRDFRNEMALFRAQRLNRDAAKHIRGFKESDPFARDIIHQASKIPDLLNAEKFLDRAVWQFLDDLCNGHYHDIVTIFVYGLKLRILARHQAYSSPQGRSAFDEIRRMEFPQSCILESRTK